MSRAIVTARLLDELHRASGEIRLPKDALVTPAARDWLKEHKVVVAWDEPGKGGGCGTLGAVMDMNLPEMRSVRAMLDRLGALAEVVEPVGGRSGILAATRRLCAKISRREVTRGIVFAPDGALPACVANKHNGIRAAVGTSVPMVEEACRELGINVLVLEYPTQTAFLMRQMIERLLKGPTAPKPETAANLAAIEQGGGRADW